jgi:hypothetical protein
MSFGIKHILGKNKFENFSNFKAVRFGVVVSVDSIVSTSENESQRERDRRYNADQFIIRARILGSDFDKNKPVDKIPNAYPLIPKHVSVPPKVGELVLLFFFSDDLKNSDRLYIGPLISSPLNLFKDELEDATSSFSIGHKEPTQDVSKIPEAKGIYPDNKDVSIQGRNNAHLAFGDNEAVLRAGKFVIDNNTQYNEKNPSYLHIKYDVPLETPEENKTQKRGSVANLISNKINLISVGNGKEDFKVTDRDSLISEEELINIVENAEPLVFGNPLMTYLDKLERAFINHVHAGNGLPPTAMAGDNSITDFIDYAKKKRELMLSKNIRIN